MKKLTRSKLRKIIKEEARKLEERGRLDEAVGGVVSTGAINQNYKGHSADLDRYTVKDAQNDFGGRGNERSAFSSDEKIEENTNSVLNSLFEQMTEVEAALNNDGRGEEANKVGKVRRALMSALA